MKKALVLTYEEETWHSFYRNLCHNMSHLDAFKITITRHAVISSTWLSVRLEWRQAGISCNGISYYPMLIPSDTTVNSSLGFWFTNQRKYQEDGADIYSSSLRNYYVTLSKSLGLSRQWQKCWQRDESITANCVYPSAPCRLISNLNRRCCC